MTAMPMGSTPRTSTVCQHQADGIAPPLLEDQGGVVQGRDGSVPTLGGGDGGGRV